MSNANGRRLRNRAPPRCRGSCRSRRSRPPRSDAAPVARLTWYSEFAVRPPAVRLLPTRYACPVAPLMSKPVKPPPVVRLNPIGPTVFNLPSFGGACRVQHVVPCLQIVEHRGRRAGKAVGVRAVHDGRNIAFVRIAHAGDERQRAVRERSTTPVSGCTRRLFGAAPLLKHADAVDCRIEVDRLVSTHWRRG